jgi:hypothetical protein
MCENCTKQRAQIKNDVLALLNEEPDSVLRDAVEKQIPAVEKQVNRRIKNAIDEGHVKRIPTPGEVHECVRDTLIAAVLATAAAAMAKSTPGYTDEGGLPASIILGQWAGILLDNEISATVEQASAEELLRQALGMGDN